MRCGKHDLPTYARIKSLYINGRKIVEVVEKGKFQATSPVMLESPCCRPSNHKPLPIDVNVCSSADNFKPQDDQKVVIT